MGNGVGKEEPEEKQIKNTNKIFLDEGVGIESSQLSRKWTQKLSLFRNMDSSKYTEHTPRKNCKFNINKTFLNYSLKNRNLTQQCIIQINLFILNKFRISQFRMTLISNKWHKLFFRLFQQEENAIINPKFYKQLAQRNSDSDIEDHSYDEKLNQEKDGSKRTSKLDLNHDDSLEECKDELTKRFKQQIDEIQNENSEDSSVNSTQDLDFVEQIDLEYGLNDNSNQLILSARQYLSPQYHLKRLYIRTRITLEKVMQGSEKKVKFDAKQDEFNDPMIEQADDLSQRSQSQNQPKQREYQPQDFLSEIGIAVVCRKGSKREGPHMSDYFIYSDQFSKVILLTSGHGEYGHHISHLAYRLLFHYLIKMPIFYTNPKKALQKQLYRLQDQVKSYIEKKHLSGQFNCILSGCVITVVIQREGRLIFGHLGDNRATIYKELQHLNKQKKIVVELTPLHCPMDMNEKSRIFTSGGEVRKNNQMDEFVYVRGRLYPQLHVTRSIGDLVGHVIGVSSEPFIKEYDITPFDTFLTVTTAPTFLYMEQEEIMNHLTGFTLKNIRQACDSLYKRCKSSWVMSEGVWEDMTIVMLWLGSYREQK